MSGVFSGDDPLPGFISVVAAFRAFQVAKRGRDWGQDYHLLVAAGTDDASRERWQDERQQELKADESEFMSAVMADLIEVVVQRPDGRLSTITPDHIAESMLPPSALISPELWGFPGDTTTQAIAERKADSLARYAGRTPLVKRAEFMTWLASVYPGAPVAEAAPSVRKLRHDAPEILAAFASWQADTPLPHGREQIRKWAADTFGGSVDSPSKLGDYLNSLDAKKHPRKVGRPSKRSANKPKTDQNSNG